MEYASGFGRAGEGEWWLGLRWLHALTYAQPYQVRFLMRDMGRRRFKAEYLTFRFGGFQCLAVPSFGFEYCVWEGGL